MNPYRRLLQLRHRLQEQHVLRQVIDRDRECQFWGHVYDTPARGANYAGTPTRCSAVHVVVNTQPNQPLDHIHCTLLCTTHYHFVCTHPDVADELELAPRGTP